MFTIYRYDVGGRKHDRYFRSWGNAQELLEEDLKNLLKKGWKQTSHRDFVDTAKGYEVFDYSLESNDGFEARLSLMNAYFSD